MPNNVNLNKKLQVKPKSRTFYYRNRHGKVVALQEEVAAEQHNKHQKYLGNSDDLKKIGYNRREQLGKYLEENEDIIDKEPPQDQRRELRTKNGTYLKGQKQKPQKSNQEIDIEKLVQQRVKEELSKIKNNGQENTQQNKGNSGQSSKEKSNEEEENKNS